MGVFHTRHQAVRKEQLWKKKQRDICFSNTWDTFMWTLTQTGSTDLPRGDIFDLIAVSGADETSERIGQLDFGLPPSTQ